MSKYAFPGKSFVYHHMLRTFPNDHPRLPRDHDVKSLMTSYVTKLNLENGL